MFFVQIGTKINGRPEIRRNIISCQRGDSAEGVIKDNMILRRNMPCVNGCLRQVTFEFDFKNFKTAKLPHKNEIDNRLR